VIGGWAGERAFQFDLERAVFLTVLHRLFDPGSDRAAEKWRRGLVIDGVGELELHHLYRAMGWLGDKLADHSGRGLAPRTTKGLVEERLFTLRNNPFSELSLVFSTSPRSISTTPKSCLPPARSSANTTRPSAATSSPRSSPSSCARNSRITSPL
jgi:hypothetical protein